MRPTNHPLAAVLLCLTLTSLTGCGYVHFGRLDSPVATSNPELAAENVDLKLEKKILQQELALARREGDTLRAALDSRSNGDDSDLATKLRETTRELATLRADYARLQSERGQVGNITSSAGNTELLEQVATLKTQLGTTTGKLAQATQGQQAAEQENSRLRTQLDGLRRENATLADQVLSLTAQNEQAAAALSQLNTELLAQRNARQAAEDRTKAAQAQMQLVLAKQRDNSTLSLSDARQTSVSSAQDTEATLRIADGADTASTAVLRTNPERVQSAAAEPAVRYHVVEEDDTLEKISLKYYGRSDQWRKIYAANNTLLRGGRPLKPGMKLEIPE